MFQIFNSFRLLTIIWTTTTGICISHSTTLKLDSFGANYILWYSFKRPSLRIQYPLHSTVDISGLVIRPSCGAKLTYKHSTIINSRSLEQIWARRIGEIEGDNISTKIGSGRDRGGLPDFLTNRDRGALSRVFLDFSRPFQVRKKLGKIEGNRDKSRKSG